MLGSPRVKVCQIGGEVAGRRSDERPARLEWGCLAQTMHFSKTYP